MAKPTAQDVAKRLLILKYVVIKAVSLPPLDVLQNLLSQWSKDDQRKFTNELEERGKQMVSSLKSNGLWDLTTAEEREFIQSVPPKMSLQIHLNAIWRLESIAVLMWALGIIKDFPTYDYSIEPDLLKQVPFEELSGFINGSKLLSDVEIEGKQSLAELWHWRSRTRQLVEDGQTPPKELGFNSYDNVVQLVANEAFKQGDLPQLVENDFPVKGKPYRDLTAEEWSETRSIAMERHFALNWLCGYAPDNQWDKTPTST